MSASAQNIQGWQPIETYNKKTYPGDVLVVNEGQVYLAWVDYNGVWVDATNPDYVSLLNVTFLKPLDKPPMIEQQFKETK